MSLSYIKIFCDCLETLEPLNDAERGRLFTALLQYAKTGETAALQGNERFIFPTLRAQLDRDAATYERKCRANQENGKNGGRPSKNPENPLGFSETQKTQPAQEEEKDEYKEKEKDNIFSGAVRPREKKAGKNFSVPRKPNPQQARADLERMDRFLKQLYEKEEDSS